MAGLGVSAVVVATLISVSNFHLNWRDLFCLRDKERERELGFFVGRLV